MSNSIRKAGRQSPGKRPVGIFVLGMHRSGTSLLTRILNLLGCALPGDLLGANESNPTGHWESLRAIEINDGLLYALGRSWDDVRKLPADWMQRPEAEVARLQIRAFLDREFSSANLWLLKDPRLCRLAPLWLEVAEELGVDIRVIIPVRHPSEVAYSLIRREGKASGQSQLLWFQYLMEAEEATRKKIRVLVHFEDVVSDWRAQTDRIATQLGLAWPVKLDEVAVRIDNLINPELVHSDAFDPDDGLTDRVTSAPPVTELYQQLRDARENKVWEVIERASVAIGHNTSLFWQAIDELAERAGRIGRRASALDAILAEKLAGGGAWLLNDVEIHTLLLETQRIVARLDETAPLTIELMRQVEAQRKEIGTAAASHSDDSRTILEKLEPSLPLLAEIVQQIELQRSDLATTTTVLACESRSLREKVEQTEPLIAELVRQMETQRTESTAQRALPIAHEQLLALTNKFEESRAVQVESVQSLLRLLEMARQGNLALDMENQALRLKIDGHATQVESLATQVRKASTTLTAREAALAEYREHAEALESKVADMARELEVQCNRVFELVNSRSWKLMAPLRLLRRFGSRRPAAPSRANDRMLKSLYVALPISVPTRLRLKSVVFRLLRPLIRNTDPYRRWQAHGISRAFPGAVINEPVRTDKADAVAAKNAKSRDIYIPLAHDAVLEKELRAKLIAFYLPQFHPIPENDEWWGRGFTEWTNVTKAAPQFDGHEQPHLPGELGFYDLRLPEVMARQIELARQYGVHGFCFHYYWFDGRRVLERPLDQFMGNPAFDFPFCICWANESWTRRWDGHDNDVLLGQEHTPESDLLFIKDIEPILRDPRYIRVGGRPLIIVYRPALLPDCAATVSRWRAHCRAVGIGEILLAMVQFDAEDPRPFGFDAAVEFPPHKLARNLPSINAALPSLNPDFAGYVIDYQDVVDRSKSWPVPDFDLFRGVFPGWDNEARKPQQGYMFAYSSPDRYRDWLGSAVDYSRQHPVHGESLVFVNAWNEWAEGAYLEPDRRYGYAYLQATRDALTQGCRPSQGADADPSASHRIVVVSHDAHPHGAQYLALYLCHELSRSLGWPVDAVLLGEGVLEDEFRRVATVHRLPCRGGSPTGMALAHKLMASGANIAIANTTASGMFVSDLKRAGFRVASLVHELPGVIESMALQKHAKCIAKDADLVVFAGAAVRDGFELFAPLEPDRVLIRPQGLYKRNRYQSASSIASVRVELRQRLGLRPDALIVLSVGYADLRKGADLFIDIGERLICQDARIHMVWLGHLDSGLESKLRSKIKASGFSEHFHFPGRDTDTDPYYAGSDLYALTSREDPFPSVIMEALDAAVPVVAFAGVGGFDALLDRAGGRLVPALKVEEYARECATLLSDEVPRRRLGHAGKAVVDAEFSFPEYVRGLLRHCGLAMPKVSVIVPNYNYARYLSDRLNSIVGQTLRPYEIIVLDDASTDDSLDVLRELQSSLPLPLRVVTSAANSGSVFRQWLKGVELAGGDYVWIAEADDLAEPTFLATVMEAFNRPNVAMSYCQSQQIDEDGTNLSNDYLDYVSDISKERWRQSYIADGAEELVNGLAVKNTVPNVSAVVFNREALYEALINCGDELYEFSVAGDWLVYLRLLEGGLLAYNPQSLNKHRRHRGSVTLGSAYAAHLREVLRMQKIARERYGAVTEETRAWEYANKLYRQFNLANADVPTLDSRTNLHKILN
jgi:glycosyltransferase involved in cell wall biosynthesis